ATGLWPVLADLGFYPRDWLGQFGKVGSPLNDHPNMKGARGIDVSSGSLGHNLSVGAGMAIAARLTGRDYRTFVLTGDGELQEGQVWEAAMAASHYKLGNLVAIVDANGFSGAGPTSQAMNIEPLGKRFEAFGWTVREIDGHDAPTLLKTFDELPDPASEEPVAIIARTRKGHGVEFMEKQPQAWHLGLLNEEQYADVVAEIIAKFPERYIEVGIAETNSVSLAAGLASAGLVPYIYSMSPFGMLKTCEQWRTDVDYNHLPVRLVGRLSGLAMGYFGTSHYAVEDIAIARTMNNTVVLSPGDAASCVSLMRSTAA